MLQYAKTQLTGPHFLMLGKRAGGGEGDRGWDSCMASLTQRTWVWANSGRQWRTGGPGVLQAMGSQRVSHESVTEREGQVNSGNASTCQYRRLSRLVLDLWVRKVPGSRRWQPTLVFLPGKFHGQKSLEGYSPWGHKELDMTEQLSMYHITNYIFSSTVLSWNNWINSTVSNIVKRIPPVSLPDFL